ncbi:MAG: hypothetical protein LCH87_15645 [Actinobacteria bacterium]|nr:hypothetical protein [Actinomycetota bacterium]
MEDPKRQAWMYVVVGPLAIIAGIYFLMTTSGTTGDFSLLDWAIIGMGVVATYRGVKGFLDIRRGDAPPAEPGESTTFRRKLPPPEGPKAKG